MRKMNINKTSVAIDTLEETIEFSSILEIIIRQTLEHSRYFFTSLEYFNKIQPDVKRLFLTFFIMQVCDAIKTSPTKPRMLLVDEDSVNKIISRPSDAPQRVIRDWTDEGLDVVCKYLPIAVVRVAASQSAGDREESYMKARAALEHFDRRPYSAKNLKKFAERHGLKHIANSFTTSPDFFNALARCA